MKDYLKAVEIFKSSKEKFYNVNKNAQSFTLLPGKNKGIIFSCPHAVAQIREGKEKLADIFTGPLGLALNNLGYEVLIKTNTFNDDANYDRKSPYKKYLSKVIKKEKVKFLIDLHGMSSKREILISLGTSYGKNIDKNIESTRLFTMCASNNSLNSNLIRVDFPFSASKRTVSYYINRKNKIETLQIELNSKLFNDSENVLKLLKTLDEFAEKIVKIKNFKPKKISKSVFERYDKEILNQNFNEKPFLFKEGDSDILITAPHSASMFKEGRECYKESFSGAIALQMFDLLPTNILIKTSSTNYDSSQEYLQKIEKIAENKKIKFVLELHIMNKFRPEDIVIVCNNARTIDYNIALLSNTLKILHLSGFKNCSIDYPFNSENLNSTVNLIKQNLNICAMQFIINQKIIDNKRKYKKLMKILQNIFNILSC